MIRARGFSVLVLVVSMAAAASPHPGVRRENRHHRDEERRPDHRGGETARARLPDLQDRRHGNAQRRVGQGRRGHGEDELRGRRSPGRDLHRHAAAGTGGGAADRAGTGRPPDDRDGRRRAHPAPGEFLLGRRRRLDRRRPELRQLEPAGHPRHLRRGPLQAPVLRGRLLALVDADPAAGGRGHAAQRPDAQLPPPLSRTGGSPSRSPSWSRTRRWGSTCGLRPPAAAAGSSSRPRTTSCCSGWAST